MLQFIPFVPRDANGISEELWETAYGSWLALLSSLLNKSDPEFVQEIETNTSLHSFINDTIDAQIDMTTIDAEISKLVFLTIIRTAQLGAKSPLIARSTLCNFAMVYGTSNTTAVRSMFRRLNLDLSDPLNALLECIQEMPRNTALDCASLDRAHVAARLLYILTLVWDGYDEEPLQDILFKVYEDITTHLQPKDESLRIHVYQIKRALVSTLDNLVVKQFFRPLGFETSTAHHTQLERIDTNPTIDIDDLLSDLSTRFTEWFESSGLEEKRSAYIDAPLIMDWEVDYAISDKLAVINNISFKGDNEHIEYLRLSLNQVCDMNQATSKWMNIIRRHPISVSLQTAHTLPMLETPANEPAIERTLKISQVQDVFPDLGDGFVQACLAANGDNVEDVIAQILEDDLPPAVAGLDRHMEKLEIQSPPSHVIDDIPQYEADPSQSILAMRHNIFDGDKFDVFNNNGPVIIHGHVGKKNHGTTEKLLNNRSFSEDEKKKTLERIYNMYEDEYDDTYDEINEVSGRVELDAVEEGGEALDTVKAKKEQVDPGILNESDLVHAFMENRDVFGRTSAIRKSKQRVDMRKRTNMTDEQLEGWAIMFDRNPRKQRILDKYMLFDGAQNELTDAQKKAQSQPKSTKPPPPQSSAKDRAYKDKNKARFGNHNRKKMHDRKLGSSTPRSE